MLSPASSTFPKEALLMLLIYRTVEFPVYMPICVCMCYSLLIYSSTCLVLFLFSKNNEIVKTFFPALTSVYSEIGRQEKHQNKILMIYWGELFNENRR